jgi:hypothetical protein
MKQSSGRNVTPLEQIILIPIKPVCSFSLMLIAKQRSKNNQLYRPWFDRFSEFVELTLSNISSLLYLIGLLAEHIDYIPTDEILDALAPEIGIRSFHLGIVLGLCEGDLERIQNRYQHDLVKQTQQVLYEWRNDTTVKATLGVLGQALDNVGMGSMCLKRVVEHIGVEKLYNSRQQSNQPPSERTWGRQIANMCSIY